MNKKAQGIPIETVIIAVIVLVVIAVVIAFLITYEPQCSIRDDPFSMHKASVNIGKEYQSYQDTLLCKRDGLFDWHWEKIAIIPEITIRIENISPQSSFEGRFPKWDGKVFLEDNTRLIGDMEGGIYKSHNYHLPSCKIDNKTESGFCNYTVYIQIDDKLCSQYIGSVNYENYYYIPTESCKTYDMKHLHNFEELIKYCKIYDRCFTLLFDKSFYTEVSQ